MTAREVIALCRHHGGAGTFAVSIREHGDLSSTDVRQVLRSAVACERRGTKEWIVRGSALDGEETRLTVLVEDGAVTVVGAAP